MRDGVGAVNTETGVVGGASDGELASTLLRIRATSLSSCVAADQARSSKVVLTVRE